MCQVLRAGPVSLGEGSHTGPSVGGAAWLAPPAPGAAPTGSNPLRSAGGPLPWACLLAKPVGFPVKHEAWGGVVHGADPAGQPGASACMSLHAHMGRAGRVQGTGVWGRAGGRPRECAGRRLQPQALPLHPQACPLPTCLYFEPYPALSGSQQPGTRQARCCSPRREAPCAAAAASWAGWRGELQGSRAPLPAVRVVRALCSDPPAAESAIAGPSNDGTAHGTSERAAAGEFGGMQGAHWQFSGTA